MTRRILVLTAGFGDGHNAAARAVAQAWDEREGEGAAIIADPFAEAHPASNAFLRRAYLSAINRLPGAWRALYGWMDRSTLLPRLLGRAPGDVRVLRALLARHQPVAVVSTFPGHNFTLRHIGRQGGTVPPRFTVVTDSISLNSLWWTGGSDAWFVPNEDSAAVLRAARVGEERIDVTGFPVPPRFARLGLTLSPPALGAGGRPRILVMIHSGRRGAERTARLLLRETGWDLTFAVGRDEGLRRHLTALAADRGGVTVLGWTREIPQLLLTHHLVISKAGGATTQEALAAGCPMVVSQVVPGQEEGNYELLRRHGIGALAETPETVVSVLREAFAREGAVLTRWRTAVAGLRRPHAAREIVDRVEARIRGEAVGAAMVE
ncbi:MAG: MGDG synthase family glycosyltransferase [Opitutaceae bacterium]